VEEWVRFRSEERLRYTERVAAAVGRPAAAVADTFTRGIFMDAREASEFGLIDEICRPKGEIHQLSGPTIGFRPRR
jgi:ATP-dependent protease ClpP protease subunit